MRRKVIERIVLTALLAAPAPAALAQPQRRVAPAPLPAPAIRTLEFVAPEIPMGPALKGAPFSAESVTTVTQTLGDGTRIERRVTAKMYRDSEGRMRREQTVLGLDALSPSADAQPMVTISDPVAGVAYVLDPNTRTARRSTLMSRDRAREIERARDLEKLRAAAELTRQRLGEPPPPPPPPPPLPGVRPRSRPDGVANWPEPLGTRQIEGVAATGTRRTETIPAGRIGNDRPIVITDERWESPDLKVLVLSQHHDPRTGDVEYRLTNISRAEPAPHLFALPADYSIVDAPPPPPPPPAPWP